MSTIILVHGLWVTPRSWERWVPYYEAKGHTVLTPAYPGFDVEVGALRADPTPIATVTVPETVAHLEKIITDQPEKPIIIGHSFGGTLTQLLLDRGHGAAGVVIDSAPPEGIRVTPPSQIRSLFPILNNPAKRHQAAGFTPAQFHYAFSNTLSEEDSLAAYENDATSRESGRTWHRRRHLGSAAGTGVPAAPRGSFRVGAG
ncbi:alpha/beta fold hydrolase [Dactylosporangium sp. McL0621]|uniref:alpha/beta fold hydrolase n=1 Tax=Dactylosporangium sp. McL0621 TaxID=3415678 RepID=UPI003CF67329